MSAANDYDRISQLESEVSELRVQNTELQSRQGAKSHPKRVTWRSVLSTGLLTLGLLAAVPAGAIVWLHRTVVDPQAYMASVGPVIKEPAVQAAIQKSATQELYSRVDINSVVGQALPEKAAFLAAPIATQVKTYANTTIGNIVASPKFADVWVNTHERAHARFMQIAENSNTNPDIDISRVYAFISQQLEATPLAALGHRDLPPSVGKIHVVTVPALALIPHYVAMLNTWTWALVGLVALLLALAVAISSNRRRTLVWTGLGIILAGLVTLIAIRITRVTMLDSIRDNVYRDAAVAIWQTVLYPFWQQLAATALIGLALTLTGWLLGPGRVASWVREQTQGLLGQGRTALLPTLDRAPAVQFVGRHHGVFLWGILVVTLFALALNIPLKAPEVAGIVLIALLVLLVLEFLVAPLVPAESKKPHEHTH
jgi:hypothetical protein